MPGARCPPVPKDIPSTKPRLDKLGVKEGMRVCVLGVPDAEGHRTEAVHVPRLPTHHVEHEDVVLVGVAREADLASAMARGRACMARDGMLWVVRPKGKGGVPEDAVMRAGKEAGLVDTKVVAFSASHTAEKFVFRLRDR